MRRFFFQSRVAQQISLLVGGWMGVVLWVKTGENMKHWYAVVDGDLGVQWRCVGLYAS
jgi:hypothetical protein